MTAIVVAGPDPQNLGRHLTDAGATVSRIGGRATRSALDGAGIASADILVLTDPADGTAIPVANELGDPQVFVYAEDQLPEFARHQADLILDPALVSREMVVEELLAED